MKTGDQVFADVSQVVAWLVAAVALLQKHGFSVHERFASLVNDPQFVTLAVGAAVLLVIRVRQSRIARIVALAADAAERAAEKRFDPSASGQE